MKILNLTRSRSLLLISLIMLGSNSIEAQVINGQSLTRSGSGATRRIISTNTTTTASISKLYASDTLKNVHYTLIGGGGGGASGIALGGGGGGQIQNMVTPGTNVVTAFSSLSLAGSAAAATAGASTTVTFNGTTITALGGAAGVSTASVATGSSGSGNAGGTNSALTGSGGYGGGGGGGSGGLGNSGTNNGLTGANGSGTGGIGGIGTTPTIADGSNTFTFAYGGGGGGSGKAGSGAGSVSALSGGGGAGGYNSAGGNGTNNSGGGGGGGTTGGTGGSGLIIISCSNTEDRVTGNTLTAADGNTNIANHVTGDPIKIYNTTTTTFAINDNTADVFIEDCALVMSGSITCRNLYINGTSTIAFSGGGSLTCNTVFYSGVGGTIPTALSYTNLYILGLNTSTSSVANITVTLPADKTVTNLYVYSGSKLNLNGKTLTVTNIKSSYGNGQFSALSAANSGQGVMVGSANSIVVINTSGSGTLYMDQTSESTKTLKYLKLNSGAALTLGNDLVIYGGSGNTTGDVELVQTSPSTLTTGGFLTLRYNVTSDIPAIIGGLEGISGNVNYEDCFVSGYRAYRQTGSILSGGLPVSQMLDDFDLYATSNGTSNADGFLTASTAATPSLFLYNETLSPKWNPFLMANSGQVIPRGLGCMFFMRPTGSGTGGNYNAQLLDYTGAINNANFTLGAGTLKYSGSSITSTNGYNLITNPYAAYLNINDFLETDNNHLDLVVYKYEKASKNYSTYVRKSGSSGASAPWQKSGITATDYNQFIDPGDAFWVKLNTTSTTTLVYNLTRLSTTKSGNNIVRGNKMELDSQSYASLGVSMKLNSDSLFVDGVTLFNGNTGGNTNVDTRNGDAYDLISNCNDLSIVGWNNEFLSVKSLNNNSNWIVPLKVSTCAKGKGVFLFDIDYNKPGLESTFSLFDKWLNKKVAIMEGSKYEFEITDDAQSKGADRFYINMDNSSLSTVKNELQGKSILCYPNPISRNGTLQVSLPNLESAEIEIKNVLGQLILKIEIPANIGIPRIDLAPLNILPGTYFVQCKQKTGFIVKSVTVI